MAKWEVGVERTEDRFFFGMFDGVAYLIPLEHRGAWAVWTRLNSPNLPAYAAVCPGFFEMSFKAPKPLTEKRSPEVGEALARLAQR